MRVTPEEWLSRALEAKGAKRRGLCARRGLSTHERLDATTHALLLRQLYLSLFEEEQFAEAETCALQASALGVLGDVMLQDAARAAVALGDVDAAVGHLRKAARTAPIGRRAFHYWTLGSMCFLAQRTTEAITYLARALRLAGAERPLFRAHLALAQLAAGEEVNHLQSIVSDLASSANAQGYGRFVLGHLAYAAREWGAAERYLEMFVSKVNQGNPAQALALRGELALAHATLHKMQTN